MAIPPDRIVVTKVFRLTPSILAFSAKARCSDLRTRWTHLPLYLSSMGEGRGTTQYGRDRLPDIADGILRSFAIAHDPGKVGYGREIAAAVVIRERADEQRVVCRVGARAFLLAIVVLYERDELADIRRLDRPSFGSLPRKEAKMIRARRSRHR